MIPILYLAIQSLKKGLESNKVRILTMPQALVARTPREQNWPCLAGSRDGSTLAPINQSDDKELASGWKLANNQSGRK